MVVLDHDARAVAPGNVYAGLYIQLVGGFSKTDIDDVALNELLCSCNREVVKVMKYLQPVFRPSAHCTQRCRYMQTHHSGTGDSYAHSVLEDVSADLDVEVISVGIPPLVRVQPASFLGNLHCLCCRKGYCDRLCTSKSRLYFLSDQFNDLGFTCGHFLKNSKVRVIMSLMLSSDSSASIGKPRHTVL